MILAIDAGNKQSGYAILKDDYTPFAFGKVPNEELEKIMEGLEGIDLIVLEMVASYGMAVGETVFDTCVEIGRLQYISETIAPVWMVKRKEYVTDLCGSSRAKDSNVVQYLIDRFAKDTPNRGKGTKKAKGWFYGFKADCWQAYAIGVWALDKLKEEK